jgi:hypothetical protein
MLHHKVKSRRRIVQVCIAAIVKHHGAVGRGRSGTHGTHLHHVVVVIVAGGAGVVVIIVAAPSSSCPMILIVTGQVGNILAVRVIAGSVAARLVVGSRVVVVVLLLLLVLELEGDHRSRIIKARRQTGRRRLALTGRIIGRWNGALVAQLGTARDFAFQWLGRWRSGGADARPRCR